jgi:hypothetical protein
MHANSDWGSASWGRALLMGIGLAVALMGTDFGSLGQALVGFYNDDWANGIYLHHQVHAALLGGRLDLSDPAQFFPFGYNPAHTNGGNILEMLVSGVFRIVAPWPTWLSLGALAWIPLNVLAFVPLGRRLWRSEVAVLSAAASWALFPPVLHHLQAGRLTQVALIGVPVALAGMLDLTEGPGRKGVGLTAIGLALTGLGYWFNALFLALLCPVFLVYGWRRRQIGELAVDMLAAGALALVIVSPFLAVAFWPVLSGGALPGTHVDPTALPLVFPDALRLSGGQAPGLANWLPWVAVPGAVLSMWRGQRRGLWLGLCALVVVFSMGPGQMVGGEVVRMPYFPFWKLVPGLSRMFHPDRWMLIGGVFIAILAVDGLARLFPRWTWLIPVGVFAQLHLRGVAPLDVWTPNTPAHWSALAAEVAPGAVIVLPLHGAQLAGQYQHVHGRSLWGGMVEDQPWAHPKAWVDYERGSVILKDLRALSYGRDPALQWSEADVQQLCHDGFGWVVLDQSSWSRLSRPVGPAPRQAVTRAMGMPTFSGPSGVVWSLGCSQEG